MKKTYIEAITAQDSGGGSMVDLVYLKSGVLLVVTDEGITAFQNDRAYQLDLEPIGVINTFD